MKSMRFRRYSIGATVVLTALFVVGGFAGEAADGSQLDSATAEQMIDQAIDHARQLDMDMGDQVEDDLAPLREAIARGGKAVHGESKEVNTSPLEWQANLSIWTGVVFLILLLVLWKFAWGPIADGLSRREQGIANQITEAQQANENAKQILGQYQEKLDAAGEETRRLLEQARRDAEQAGRRIVDSARQVAKSEQQKALVEIDQATAAALGELAKRSATLAVELAGKIVKSELRPEDHAKLVQQAVADFAKPSEN